MIKTKNDKFDTLFKTKIPKNIPWLAARPLSALIRENPPPPSRGQKIFSLPSCGSLIPFTRANAQWAIHG